MQFDESRKSRGRPNSQGNLSRARLVSSLVNEIDRLSCSETGKMKKLTAEEERILDEKIRKHIESLPELTPERRAMFDKYGDFIRKPESPESSSTDQETT